MAKDISANPWVFDAAGQCEGFGPQKDTVKSRYEPVGTPPAISAADAPNFICKLNIRQIKVVTGSTGGDVLVYSRAASGTADPTTENEPDVNKRYEVLFLDATPANDTLWVPMDVTVDGIYVNTLPTGAKLYVYLSEK
jgi:hypothetical protein